MRANRTLEMFTFDSYGVISRIVGSGIDKDPANLMTRLPPPPQPRRILNFFGVLFRPVFHSSDRIQYFERDGFAFDNNCTGRLIIIDRGTPRSSSRVGPATGYLRHWLKTKDRPRSSNALHLHVFFFF